jgi:hypothetical protein
VLGIAGLLVRMQDGLPMRAINHHGDGAEIVAQARKQHDLLQAADTWEKCDDATMSPVAKEICSAYGDVHGTPIVVWGDSHAGAWSTVFHQIAKERHLRLYLFWSGGCPPIVEVRRTDSIARARGLCATFGSAESVLDAIKAIHPQHIFVIGYWGLYTHSSDTAVEGEPEHLSKSAREVALRERMVRTLLTVSAIAPTTVFRSMPSLLNDAERGLARGFPLEPSLKAHRAYEAGLDPAIDEAVARTGDIQVFDPASVTCQESCTAVLQNTLLYRDTNHVSRAGSLVFKDVLLKGYFGFLTPR